MTGSGRWAAVGVVCGLLIAAANVQAQCFVLYNSEHLDVTSYYDCGWLFEESSTDVQHDGTVTKLDAYDLSSVAVSGGIVGSLNTNHSSSVAVTGGIVEQLNAHNLRLNGPQRVTVDSGTVDELNAYIELEGNDHFSYAGLLSDLVAVGVQAAPGTVGSISAERITAREESSVTISGGSVEQLDVHDLRMNGTQRVTVDGGTVKDLRVSIDLEGEDHFSYAGLPSDLIAVGVQAEPGTVSNVLAEHITARVQTTVEISGGKVERLDIEDAGTAYLSGGDVNILNNRHTAMLHMSDGSISRLNATDLRTDGSARATITGGTVDVLRPSITLNNNDYYHYGGDLDVSDLAAFGIQAAPGTIGQIQTERITARGNSTLDFASGNMGWIYAEQSGIVNISDGGAYWVEAGDSGSVNVSGGHITGDSSAGGLYARGNSEVNISGGRVDWLYAYDSSTVEVSDGMVGSLFARLDHLDEGSVDITGGIMTKLFAHEASTVNVFDGLIGGAGSSFGLYAYDDCEVNVSGGIVDRLWVMDDSTVTLIGHDFELGGGLFWGPDGETVLGIGLLRGKWYGQSTMWTIDVRGNQATLLAIPEPATLVLLTLGALAALRRRRHHS